MSRRPSTPPSRDNPSYLTNLAGSSFLVAGAPSSDDHSRQQHGYDPSRAGHSTVAPSYYSGPVTHPSDIYGRPTAPSEVEFNFGDDVSTIAPDDSVSQMNRRMTGKRLGGPRPMESSLSPPIPVIAERDETLYHQYVLPAMLEDDRSTIAGAQGQAQERAPSREMQSSVRAVPTTTYSTRQYAQEDDDDFDRGHGVNSSSAAIPLVPSGEGMTGFRSESGMGKEGSTVTAYRTPVAGYAAVGGHDEEEEGGAPYAAYSRARDQNLEASMREGRNGLNASDGSATLASRWSNPFDYMKSFHSPSSSYADDRKDSYPPTSFGEIPNKSRSAPASINIVEAQDQDPSFMRKAPLWKRMIYDTTPLPLRIQEHKQGLGIMKRPWACWILSGVYCMVMVIEMVRMAQYTGSPIQTKPTFNVMIGPSASVMINTGARFAGCQKYIANITDIQWLCLADSNTATVLSSAATCTMSEICGFGGFATPQDADQSFRFILPIFLHAGIIHLLLNVLAQCFSSGLAEKQMGTPKFLLIYFSAGVFGFILGSNFALVGQPSVGASGAIFGTHAAMLVDLLAHWSIEYRPKRKLLYLILEIIVGLALGLVPGVDNFAHLGGFLIGLLGSILLLPIIHQTKRHRITLIILRLIALPLIIVLFVVLTRNFYTTDPTKACSWCRYLSCWPTSSNNKCRGTGLSSVSTNSSASFGSILSILVTTFLVPLL